MLTSVVEVQLPNVTDVAMATVAAAGEHPALLSPHDDSLALAELQWNRKEHTACRRCENITVKTVKVIDRLQTGWRLSLGSEYYDSRFRLFNEFVSAMVMHSWRRYFLVTFISINVNWPDRISNNELWEETGEKPVQEQLRRRKRKWFGHSHAHSGDPMTVLPIKHYSGHHKATEEEADPGTLGEEIWRRKCGRKASGTAGGRWRWRLKTELDGVEWSVAYAPLAATRHKSSRVHCYISLTGSLTITDRRRRPTSFIIIIITLWYIINIVIR